MTPIVLLCIGLIKFGIIKCCTTKFFITPEKIISIVRSIRNHRNISFFRNHRNNPRYILESSMRKFRFTIQYNSITNFTQDITTDQHKCENINMHISRK